MLVLVALFMMIFAGKSVFTTGVFLLAFTVFLFIIPMVAPVVTLRNALGSSREAYIAENGIVYEGAVYPFQSFLMKMDGAAFNKRTGKKPAELIFFFTQFIGLNIISSFDIEALVPGDEVEADSKIAYMRLSSANREENATPESTIQIFLKVFSEGRPRRL